MKTFLLPTLCLASGLFAGCSDFDSPTASDAANDQPKAERLPQAPPPHVNRTAAELLIGKWKIVERGNPPKPPAIDTVMEFKNDGKLLVRMGEPGSLFEYAGTYRLDGQSLVLIRPMIAPEPGQTLATTIVSISEDELVFLDPPNRTGQRIRNVAKKFRP